MSRKPLVVAVAVLLGMLWWAPRGSAEQWYFETLDGHQNGPNGQVNARIEGETSIVLYGAGPHVFYRDMTNGNLRHAWWTGAAWYFETLDGVPGPNGRIDADVGTFNHALLYNGLPHVFYSATTSTSTDAELVRHAWWSGTTWWFETLDGAGGANGRTDGNVGRHVGTVSYGGNPHAFYENGTDGHLRHAWWTGTTWLFEVLDGGGGPNGRVNQPTGWYAEPRLFAGHPHVWYWDPTDGYLRHAWWTGTAWWFETLDGHMNGPNGQVTGYLGFFTASILFKGMPHVWYWDIATGDFRHAWWSGTTWWFETLDGHKTGPNGQINGNTGQENDAVLYRGLPHVFSLNFTDMTMRHAWWSGTAWYFEDLDGNGGTNGRITSDVGVSNATTVFGDQLHDWYLDRSNKTLRHAWYG